MCFRSYHFTEKVPVCRKWTESRTGYGKARNPEVKSYPFYTSPLKLSVSVDNPVATVYHRDVGGWWRETKHLNR